MNRRNRSKTDTLPALDRIVAAMSEATLAVDLSGLVIAINPAALKLFGISDRASALRPIDEYDRLIRSWKVGEEVFAPHELRRALSGQPIPRQKATITTMEGSEHIIEFTATPIRDEWDVVVMAMMVASDITSEERLRAFWETVATAARGLTTELDVGRVLGSVMDQMVAVLGAEVIMGIWRLDDDQRGITMMDCRGLSESTAAMLRTLPLDCPSLLCEAARTRKLHSCEDTSAAPLSHDLDRKTASAEGLASWYSAPLISGSRLVGVVAYGSRGRLRFHREDLEAIEVVNGLFATVIDHAMLYEASERGRQEAEEVREVNRLLLNSAVRERERSELRSAELNATFNSVAAGLIAYGFEGKIVQVNPAAEAMLGYSAAEMQVPPEKLVELLRMETPEGSLLAAKDAPLARALRGETVKEFRMALHPRSGDQLQVSGSSAPILSSEGHQVGAILAFVDVTRQHELERQREEYVSLITHDLRAPLTPILGQAQLLQRTLKAKGMTREAEGAEAIARSAQRMNAMIQDLVDISRSEAKVLQPHKIAVDLSQLLHEVLNRTGTPEDRSRLHIETAGTIPAISIDPERIERVLVNLLTNALKYSTPGTPVVVRVETVGAEVRVCVIDQGPGIAHEELTHLFQRFYRSASGKKGGGLGLGLYSSQLIVAAHGGRIWAESEAGKGSNFCFTLPVT